MSRIGRLPIPIPKGVDVRIDGLTVTVKGPKGELTKTFPEGVTIAVEDGKIVVRRVSDNRRHKAFHGLTRALLANMVEGVTKGFEKKLEIEGVGYRAELQGKDLVLWVGYSHPVRLQPLPGVTFKVERGGREITVQGIDKQVVGEMAARIRRVRPPEPYKGKGIRYAGEHIRRKAGKAGKIGKGG
ncbi:MAG: 50S ribosomal protein L6 [Chloroflexi bacterium]|nr:MAG: 50S ribosomal protein L6 [Chloroflexota bacterium]HDN79354.1 50S ribosomal protein L6 [Chloroflexota bacterium]